MKTLTVLLETGGRLSMLPSKILLLWNLWDTLALWSDWDDISSPLSISSDISLLLVMSTAGQALAISESWQLYKCVYTSLNCTAAKTSKSDCVWHWVVCECDHIASWEWESTMQQCSVLSHFHLFFDWFYHSFSTETCPGNSLVHQPWVCAFKLHFSYLTCLFSGILWVQNPHCPNRDHQAKLCGNDILLRTNQNSSNKRQQVPVCTVKRNLIGLATQSWRSKSKKFLDNQKLWT